MLTKVSQCKAPLQLSANYDIIVPTADYPTITSITIIPIRGNGTDSQKRHILVSTLIKANYISLESLA